MSKSNKVDITKLALGLDIKTGTIMLGVPDKEGVLDLGKPIRDFTEAFFEMAQEITKLQLMAASIKEKEKIKKVVIATPEQQKIVNEKKVRK